MIDDSRKFLSGNEAIAHGAYRAGCTVATAYPGTPSSEILPALTQWKDRIYCEWSVNEKVALEVAIGASFAGARALVTMKHVGLNVAADPLMTQAYIGVNGGLVIVSADDPGMHSSQNEQDNRIYARFAKVPMLEPSDSQEAYEMTVTAFRISEEFDTPVILRTTTRTSHASSIVDLGEFEPLPSSGRSYSKNTDKTVAVPANARKMRLHLEERLERLKEYSEQTSLNRIEWSKSQDTECGAGALSPACAEGDLEGNSLRNTHPVDECMAGDSAPAPHRQLQDIGFITSGVCYQYVKEVFPEASVLKLGFTNPLPRLMIETFANSVDRLYVIEELDPFLEEQIRAMGIKVDDHATKLNIGEHNIERMKQLRAEILGEPAPVIVSKGVGEGLPMRPPVLCAGCGHRAVFYALNRLKASVTGDIGCYALGLMKPLDAMDTCVCMGASIGNSFGFEKAGHKGRVAAILGDSTFFHSGMTGLLNIVYNGGASTVIILDNRSTAMTGHQDNPGTGRTLMGKPAKEVSIEQVCRGLGVERVRTVGCYDMTELENVLKEELDAPEPSVVVARQPCLVAMRHMAHRQFQADSELCKGCRACLRLGCPAMEEGDPDPKNPRLRTVRMNPVLCAGCGMCFQVCKHGAIQEIKLEG